MECSTQENIHVMLIRHIYKSVQECLKMIGNNHSLSKLRVETNESKQSRITQSRKIAFFQIYNENATIIFIRDATEGRRGRR